MSQPAVWVTGASSGIGKFAALRFAENGHNVIVSSRNKSDLVNYIARENSNIHVFPMDITSTEEVDSTYNKISKEFDIECLINNAGVTVFKSAAETTEEETLSIINTNLTGAVRLTTKVLPKMIEMNKGTIINILSIAANTVFKKSSVYSASKAGLKAYANVLREEVRENNIRVINVYPGATRTPIWPNAALEEFGERMMSPDDIAKIIYDAYSNNYSSVIEDIIIRPIQGDFK